jgi:hypothetical protein
MRPQRFALLCWPFTETHGKHRWTIRIATFRLAARLLIHRTRYGNPGDGLGSESIISAPWKLISGPTAASWFSERLSGFQGQEDVRVYCFNWHDNRFSLSRFVMVDHKDASITQKHL